MQVLHRHDSTVVQFWLPSLVQADDGWFKLATSVTVPDRPKAADWSWDHLRGGRFWCGRQPCPRTVNPVAQAWLADEQAALALLSAAGGRDSLDAPAQARLAALRSHQQALQSQQQAVAYRHAVAPQAATVEGGAGR